MEGRFKGVAGDFRPPPQARLRIRELGELVLARGSAAGDEIIRSIVAIPRAPVWDKDFFTWLFLGETAAFLGPPSVPFFHRGAAEHEGPKRRLFLILAQLAEHGLPDDWCSLDGYFQSPWEEWRAEEFERPAAAPPSVGESLRRSWRQLLRYTLAGFGTVVVWLGAARLWPTQAGFLLASAVSIILILLALYWDEARAALKLLRAK